MIHVLIVTGSVDVLRVCSEAMRGLGYETDNAPDLSGALHALEAHSVQLILAEAAAGGCDLCEDLRAAGDSTPVLVLAQQPTGQDRRRIFRSGADGYVESPPDFEELQMRAKNLLWRCKIEDDSVLRFGDCILNSATLTVRTPACTIELRRLEYLLLQKLLSYPGRIFTRAQLLDELWGYDTESNPRTVDTHIKRLRRLMRDVDGVRIQTVRGLGYRACPPKK